jgi:iron complex outermembrane receptor protein
VAAAAFQGSLPEWAKLWAAPASLAFGVEYRKESADQDTDAISQRINDFTGIRGGPSARSGALGGFTQSNFQLVSGSLDVTEAFVEMALPVAANAPMADLLEVNAAARVTDYSTSGKVNTWKVGAVWKPVDAVWLRLTRSRDIRAPNTAELFSGGTAGNGFARDPVSGVTYPLLSFTRGNPHLTPENADTLTYGVVYEPPFVPGLDLSLDYYNINISDAIALLGFQVTIDECAKGSAIACEQVSFVNGGYRLSLIPLNLSSQINRGFDGEATYVFPAFGGRMILRALANYTTKNQTTTPGAASVDRAKEAGQLTATVSANFSRGPLVLNLQARLIGEGLYNAAYVVGVDIDSNDVPSRTYTDLSLKYLFQAGGSKNEAFLTINNLFNQVPPVANSMSSFVQESDYSRYDPIGTYVTAGIRFTR